MSRAYKMADPEGFSLIITIALLFPKPTNIRSLTPIL